MTEPETGSAPPEVVSAPPRPRFSLLVTLICSAVVAMYVGLPLGPLLKDTSPLAKLERPQDSLDRLVTRELDLHRVMRQSSRLEWRLYRIVTGGEDPAREAGGWYRELADAVGSTTAELYRAILRAETGDPSAAEEAVAEWKDASPPVQRMATWLAAAYLGAGPDAADGATAVAQIRDDLPSGWFADTLVERIASRTGDARARGAAAAAIEARGRVLQWRLRALMAIVAAVSAAGVAALAWMLAARRPARVADAPLPPVWGLADGYALFARGLGAPQAILLGLFFVRGSTSFESALGMVVDLPVFWWVARYLRRRGSSMRQAFGLAPARERWPELAAVSLVLIAIALSGDALIDWIARLAGLAPHWADGFSEALLWESRGAYLLDCFGAIVWAPIVEELVFRGLLYGTLRARLGVWPAAVGSALLFALPHGYAAAGSLSVFVSGVLWAIAYERTRSLWPGMLAHAANNLMSTIWLTALLRM